jgi:hypothetical protein
LYCVKSGYQNDNPSDCCVGAFHDVYLSKINALGAFVQTFAYATWLDAEIFGDSVHADVLALSHEITEWMNDPLDRTW